MTKTYISRPNEERLLQEFFESTTGSGFVCVQGRQRVGKSTLLEKLAVDKGYFYFVGAKDEHATAILKRYAKAWDRQQLCAIYMMLGGVPYYPNQIDITLGFIKSLSSAFSGAKSIFFEEINELLGIEFNQRGLFTAKAILIESRTWNGRKSF